MTATRKVWSARFSAVSGVLPGGSTTVGVGLVVSGACAYVFLALLARTLGPARYAPLAAFWSITFLIGPGFYSGPEKEVARLLSTGLATGADEGNVAKKVAWTALALTGVLVVVFGAGYSLLSDLLDGNAVLIFSLLLALPSMAVEYLALGILAGNARFSGYSGVLGLEGMVRLAGAGVLLLLGVRAGGPFGLVIVLAPLVATGLVLPSVRSLALRGPAINMAAIFRSVGWLVGGTLFSNILVSAGPITVKLLAHGRQERLTGPFLSALILVRVPLFLYNSAVATLLPVLAGQAALGDWTGFRRTVSRLSAVVLILGGLVTAGGWLIGPFLLRVIFGAAYVLPGRDIGLLAATAAALLVGTTLSAALTATGDGHLLALAWASGVAIMIGVTAIPGPLLLRVELGLLSGAVAAAAGMLVCLLARSGTTRQGPGLSSARVRRP